MLVSCPGLVPTVNSEYLIAGCRKNAIGTCHIISTQFSLPFKNMGELERERWIKYRYDYFMLSAHMSLREQVLENNSIDYIWVIFVSVGDRKLLGLKPCYLLENGITVMWIEIAHRKNQEADYYRNTIMNSICKRVASRQLMLNKNI